MTKKNTGFREKKCYATWTFLGRGHLLPRLKLDKPNCVMWKIRLQKKTKKTFILEFWLKCYNKIENQVEGPKIGFQTWEKRFCCYRLIYGEEVFLTTAEKKWNKKKKQKTK